MIFFKSKKPVIEEKDESLDVNVDLEIITKMNQEFAYSLDLNDTLKTALPVSYTHLTLPTTPYV